MCEIQPLVGRKVQTACLEHSSQMINRDPKNHISLHDWGSIPEMLVPMFKEERESERCRLL